MAEKFDPYYQWLGIPPEERPVNFYRILGLRLFESDTDVISNAANQKIAFVRTFLSGSHSEAAQRVVNDLAKVHSTLLNPAKKKVYDERLHQSLDSVDEVDLTSTLDLDSQLEAKSKEQASPTFNFSEASPTSFSDFSVSDKPKNSKRKVVKKKSSPSMSISPMVLGLIGAGVVIVILLVIIICMITGSKNNNTNSNVEPNSAVSTENNSSDKEVANPKESLDNKKSADNKADNNAKPVTSKPEEQSEPEDENADSWKPTPVAEMDAPDEDGFFIEGSLGNPTEPYWDPRSEQEQSEAQNQADSESSQEPPANLDHVTLTIPTVTAPPLYIALGIAEKLHMELEIDKQGLANSGVDLNTPIDIEFKEELLDNAFAKLSEKGGISIKRDGKKLIVKPKE